MIKPISTAPRDATVILVYHTIHGWVSARYEQATSWEHHEYGTQHEGAMWIIGDDICQEEVEEAENQYFDGNITHWTEAPAIPTSLSHYVVWGRGPFPDDMLRYDQAKIIGSVKIMDHAGFLIEGKQLPTHERWRSFGWVACRARRHYPEKNKLNDEWQVEIVSGSDIWDTIYVHSGNVIENCFIDNTSEGFFYT